MNIIQSIFFISILLSTNAQWFIKKPHRTKPMSYPNPGKRSVPEQESTFVETDCSKSYWELNSDYEKAMWMFRCAYKRSLLEINENSLLSNSYNLKDGLPSTSKHILEEKRSLHVVPPYFKDHDNSFHRFLMTFLRRGNKYTKK